MLLVEFAYLASQLSMGIRMSSPALPTLLSRTAGYPIEKSRAFRHILKLGIRHRSCLNAVNHKSIPLARIAILLIGARMGSTPIVFNAEMRLGPVKIEHNPIGTSNPARLLRQGNGGVDERFGNTETPVNLRRKRNGGKLGFHHGSRFCPHLLCNRSRELCTLCTIQTRCVGHQAVRRGKRTTHQRNTLLR